MPEGADYVEQAIPHFVHSGTGYQLLAALERAFSIPDYMLCQTADGNVYTGSGAHGQFAAKPVDIPQEFFKSAGGSAVTLALVPAIRPGAEVNGKRITTVRLHDNDMTLEWGGASKSPLARQAEAAFPELANDQHLPKLECVVAPVEAVSSGDIADPYRPRYAVHVQLLGEDGQPAKDTPEFPAVPLPVPFGGHDSGMFQFPAEGTIVELAFPDGRIDKSYIRQILAEDISLPDIKPGEQLQ